MYRQVNRPRMVRTEPAGDSTDQHRGAIRVPNDLGSWGSLLSSMGPAIRKLLEMHGLDAIQLAREAGFDLARSPSPSERIPIRQVDALIRTALPLIPDQAFGLKAASCWHPSNLGVLGHAWLSSSTLRTGLRRLVRYFRVVGERGRLEIDDVPEGVKVRYWAGRGDPTIDLVAAVTIDLAMSILLDMCRLNAGEALQPLAVSLRRMRPKDQQPYAQLYGCPIEFAASENALIFRTQDVDCPLPTSNRQLAATFDRMLNDELSRLDKHDIAARCKAVILDSLSTGELLEEEAAAQLHLSARTLQRKLAEAKTSYAQLVDDLRKDLALRYLDDPNRSVTDITYSLGFAGPSSLTRAFKRWTGVSPTDYRNRTRQAGQEGLSPRNTR